MTDESAFDQSDLVETISEAMTKGAKAAVAENDRLGLASPGATGGQLVYKLPSGEIVPAEEGEAFNAARAAQHAAPSPRLSLVVIRALDPAALAAFYAALGMSFATEQHGRGPVHFVSSDTGPVFEIYPRRPDDATTTGTRLGFATVALDVVLKALTAAGGKITTPATTTPHGRRAVVTDPEGHKVEITESV